MTCFLNKVYIRNKILSQEKMATESVAYFWGNLTEAIQDFTKGLLIMNGERQAGVASFKANKDFAIINVMYVTLSCVSI